MARPARGRKLRAGPRPRNTKVRHRELNPELSTAELAFRICAAFRAHPHVSNVLTHISRAKWNEVERSIKSIIDPAMTGDDLSPLGRNIVDLLVAERGITGAGTADPPDRGLVFRPGTEGGTSGAAARVERISRGGRRCPRRTAVNA